MKKLTYLIIFLLFIGCQDFGNLNFIADLSKDLDEVSGIETTINSDFIWMINDSGNKPRLFGISKKGKIKKELKINAKNKDWEDLTSDENGNIYIGDFGNNLSKRKNLSILKINHKDLNNDKIDIERIEFKYPNQTKFPPKKKKMFFDAEAFFYFKNYFYVFTKSRVKNKFGKTSLYKIPAKKGSHVAELIGNFENCNEMNCWITAADISKDGKKVVLLSQNSVLLFTDFKDDRFLSGNVKKIELEHVSQKESICFKDKNTLFIADEYAHGNGGNLYELNIK